MDYEIPWPQYQELGIISKDQLNLIYAFDQQPVQNRVKLLEQMGEAYVELFTALLGNISKEDCTMSILVQIDETLIANPSLGEVFHQTLLDSDARVDPFVPLMRILNQKNLEMLAVCSAILGRLLGMEATAEKYAEEVTQTQELVEHHLVLFLDWIIMRMSSSDPKQQTAAINALQSLLANDKGRVAFASSPSGVDNLSSLIAGTSAQSNPQTLYQLIFSIWCLSYNEQAAVKMAQTGVIVALANICRGVAKEKVVRVSIATLINMLGKGECNDIMVTCGWIKILQSLKQRKWADEDIKDDINTLLAALEKNMQELSSFEVYKKEVISGDLEWTPVHKSTQFWKENADKLEENKGELVKTLVGYLKSDNPTVVAVACYDLGEFIRFNPAGKKLLNEAGAKATVMGLLSHKDAEVQKQSLTCVQKLMVTNWEFLSAK